MKKVLLLLSLLILSTISTFADDLLKKAKKSPLDCALYLLSVDRHRIDEEKLADAFFQVGRYDDTIRVTEINDKGYSKFLTLSIFASKLIAKGDKLNAGKFVDKAFEDLKENEDWYDDQIEIFVDDLIYLDRLDDLAELLDHQDKKNPEEKASILLHAAKSFAKAGRTKESLAAADDAYEYYESNGDVIDLTALIEVNIKAKKYDKAMQMLAKAEDRSLGSTDINRDGWILQGIVPLYIQLGQTQKAMNIWRQHGNAGDGYDTYYGIQAFLKYENLTEAKPFLTEFQTNLGHSGDSLVKLYLKLDDIPGALRISKMISDEDDSYTQQKALMSVADRFIELGRSDSALEVVDLAFQKAARVGEQHEAHDSTSPLIRKRKYLTEIRERYLKLKRFDKVSNLPGAFKTRDDLIKPFIAHTFIALAEAQSKTLSKKELGSLIAQAQKTFDGEDDKESYHYWVVSDVINAYAIIGNKAKAMDLLTKTLNDAESDDNYYLDDLLIFTGQAFEKNNLKATPELKKVLREIIGEPVSKS